MKRIKKCTFSLGAVFLFMLGSISAQADQLEWLHAAPKKEVGISSRNISSADSIRKGNLRIEFDLKCYGTNNRSVKHPLRANSIVTSTLTIKNPVNKNEVKVKVNYPASILSDKGINPKDVSEIKVVEPANTVVKAKGNLLLLSLPSIPSVFIDSNGEVRYPSLIGDINNKQTSGSGEISNIQIDRAVFSSTSKTIGIGAAFPGEDGFCGGYRSPLMLFFSEKRPTFDNNSNFPIHHNARVYWPEKNAPGYFLVLDRNKNNKIESKEELFSDKTFENGFEALKAFDVNKDGILDKNDIIFSQLKLWQDKNGDGISQKEELYNASSKIKSISLKYQKGHVNRYLASRVEERERSEFLFIKDGKEQKGSIVDLWFQEYVEK